MTKEHAIRWLFFKLRDYMSGSGATDEDAKIMARIKAFWIDKKA